MDCSTFAESPYKLLFQGATMVPVSHYMLGFVFIGFVFLYNFLESHFLEDLLTRFRGSPVSMTYHPGSEIYQGVASKCQVIHGRYLATPWLSSPHLQTTFLSFYGNPPPVTYRRALFHASDGGTLALDWLIGFDVLEDTIYKNNVISKDDTTPVVVVIPGLTSDSSNAYIKHLAFNVAKHGWNVVVSNHRGLGGISVTSDCFYNAGWTEDLREVFKYLHHECPKAPLFAVGTSIGANILVKYLGEDGENVPVAGAAAICSPWDLLIGDRFIGRRLIQKLYDRALTSGLKGYAKLHQPRYSRLADWEGINKSRSIRDFDSYATCIVGKFETPDTYYRRCSSSSYVGNVSVPLLCISAFDDPVCTREAIPWDECRANKNIVLVTTQHGGHLAFFEGKTASSLWWVRATYEFLSVLHSSPLMHIQKKALSPGPHSSLESPIDRGPYLNVSDGLVAAMGNEQTKNDPEVHQIHSRPSKGVYDTKEGKQKTEVLSDSASDTAEADRQVVRIGDGKTSDAIAPIRRCLDELFQQSRRSMWLLTFIAITSSLPLVGTVLGLVLKKNIRKGVPAKLHKT